MKLWEALEKSNKVRRKVWENKLYHMEKDTTLFSYDIKQKTYKTQSAMLTSDFFADDWEVYKEPEKVTRERFDELHRQFAIMSVVGFDYNKAKELLTKMRDLLYKQQAYIEYLKDRGEEK